MNRIRRRRSSWDPPLKQRELPRRSTRPAREMLKRNDNTPPPPLYNLAALFAFPFTPTSSFFLLPSPTSKNQKNKPSTLSFPHKMDRWRNEIQKQPQRHSPNPPSFSSTLLDSIYRSIDDNNEATTKQQQQQQQQRLNLCFKKHNIIPPVTTPHVARLAPIRTAPVIEEKMAKKKDRQGSIRGYLRSPSSPGARLTNFIASLFAAKSKVSTEPAYSRSCLSKTPSTVKRTVRFCPVSVIVGEDCRPCGEKWVFKGRGRSEMEEEEEEDEDDLFELKSLGVVGRFRDELPVYETTILGKRGLKMTV